MKKFALAGMLLAMLFAARPATSAVQISFVEDDQTVAVGDSFTLRLRIAGETASLDPSLASFDIEIGFSDPLLAFDGAQFGDPVLGDQLNFSGLAEKSITGPFPSGANRSSVQLQEIAHEPSAPLQPGDFVLATLTFHAVSSGKAEIVILEAILDGFNGGFPQVLLDVNAVHVVPEPSSQIWMIAALGLLATGAIRARARRA
jgi:hypothetical protein